jgi:hypothetical protein
MCNFPAKELYRMRRQMVWRAEMSADPGFVATAMRFVMGVDTLRLLHEEADECLCWYEACAGEGSPSPKKPPAPAARTPEARSLGVG